VRFSGAKRAATIAFSAGALPASPIPTPKRAASSCVKLTAAPHTSVITLNTPSDPAMMARVWPRSASTAIGIPSST
jgi:hypothetical protein